MAELFRALRNQYGLDNDELKLYYPEVFPAPVTVGQSRNAYARFHGRHHRLSLPRQGRGRRSHCEDEQRDAGRLTMR